MFGQHKIVRLFFMTSSPVLLQTISTSVECFLIIQIDVSGLGNTTNNRMESINQKLKQTIALNAGMREFFKNLLVVITSMRTERLHVSHSSVMKAQIKYAYHGMDEMEPYESADSLRLRPGGKGNAKT